MEKKTQGMILFLILIIYYILWRIFYKLIPSNFDFVVWGITDFFKKQDSLKSTAEHRMDFLEQMGFYKIGNVVLVFFGVISVILGTSALVFPLFPKDDPRTLQFFWIWIIFGVILISIAFFVNKSRKNK